LTERDLLALRLDNRIIGGGILKYGRTHRERCGREPARNSSARHGDPHWRNVAGYQPADQHLASFADQTAKLGTDPATWQPESWLSETLARASENVADETPDSTQSLVQSPSNAIK
jgi:hypothetical protein